jgi:hypothetical protein
VFEWLEGDRAEIEGKSLEAGASAVRLARISASGSAESILARPLRVRDLDCVSECRMGVTWWSWKHTYSLSVPANPLADVRNVSVTMVRLTFTHVECYATEASMLTVTTNIDNDLDRES